MPGYPCCCGPGDPCDHICSHCVDNESSCCFVVGKLTGLTEESDTGTGSGDNCHDCSALQRPNENPIRGGTYLWLFQTAPCTFTATTPSTWGCGVSEASLVFSREGPGDNGDYLATFTLGDMQWIHTRAEGSGPFPCTSLSLTTWGTTVSGSGCNNSSTTLEIGSKTSEFDTLGECDWSNCVECNIDSKAPGSYQVTISGVTTNANCCDGDTTACDVVNGTFVLHKENIGTARCEWTYDFSPEICEPFGAGSSEFNRLRLSIYTSVPDGDRVEVKLDKRPPFGGESIRWRFELPSTGTGTGTDEALDCMNFSNLDIPYLDASDGNCDGPNIPPCTASSSTCTVTSL